MLYTPHKISYEDLQIMYEDRPSRPEDIDAIRHLQVELERKDDEIKKLNEQFKFYKLELVNREQSYNKMFNANPNVGVLDPLENKVLQLIYNKQKQPTAAQLKNGTNKKIKI